MTGLQYGIIGCGMMGQEHLRNIALLPGAQVTRIFEPDADMLASSLALVPEAQSAASLAEVVTSPDVDCLLIASPNFCHAEQLREIARLRPLPVLLEKPACTSLDDVRSLAALQASCCWPTRLATVTCCSSVRYFCCLPWPPLSCCFGFAMDVRLDGCWPFICSLQAWQRISCRPIAR